MKDKYVLFAVDFDGNEWIENSGNWWAVMYAVCFLSEYRSTYRHTIKSLSLYALVGNHTLN